jgi:hypothetical protein
MIMSADQRPEKRGACLYVVTGAENVATLACATEDNANRYWTLRRVE